MRQAWILWSSHLIDRYLVSPLFDLSGFSLEKYGTSNVVILRCVLKEIEKFYFTGWQLMRKQNALIFTKTLCANLSELHVRL